MADLTAFQQAQGGAGAFQFADGSGYSAKGEVVPARAVVTSNGARDQVYGAAQTLAKAESAPGNPSLSRMQEQVSSLSKAITDAGGYLSPDDQRAFDSIASLSGQSMGATAVARTSLDGKKYQDAVNGANKYNSLESQRADVLNQLYNSLSQRSSDIQTLTRLFAPSEDEAQTMKAINSTEAKLRSNDASAIAGQVAVEGQPIPMPFITGQQAQIQKMADLKRIGLSNELSGYVDLLTSQTATRQQKLDAAKFVFDANRQAMTDSITLYKELAPQNIGTSVDEFTGEMTVIMRNPLTGEVYKNNLGQVATPQKQIQNVQYAQENGVSKPFYMRDGQTVINASNGREYSTEEQAFADGVAPDWSNVQTVSANSQAERALVVDLASKYIDAGITLSDSLETAQQKVLNSGVYQDQVRPPLRSRVGSSGSSFKFTATQLAKGAAAAGLSLDEFKQLDPDTQNDFINGTYKNLQGGRVPADELTKMKASIDGAISEGEGIGELREEIDNSDLPQADKEELKTYVEQRAEEEEGLFDKILETGGSVLKKLNPFD